jgi:hypothetical protein
MLHFFLFFTTRLRARAHDAVHLDLDILGILMCGFGCCSLLRGLDQVYSDTCCIV